MAVNGQYSTKKELILCDPRVRGGMAVCFKNEECTQCDFAKKYEDEHPESVIE